VPEETPAPIPDRRKETRFPWLDSSPPIQILIGSTVLKGAVRDVSKTGLCMLVGADIIPGRFVTVAFLDQGIRRSRTLRALYSCRQADGRWLVGGLFLQPLSDEEFGGLRST